LINKVYLQRQFENVDRLKLALVEQTVADIFINRSIDEWRQRLEAVVKNNGGHTEHLFI